MADNESHVQAGACVSDDGNYQCVLERSACSDPDQFQSSRQLALLGTSSPARSCLTQTSLRATTVGRCTSGSDQRTCTSTPSGCLFPDSFQVDSFCSLLQDNEDDNLHQDTLFGSCYQTMNDVDKRQFCAWSKDDCPSTGWLVANNHFVDHQAKCRCDQVRTGACRVGNQVSCAVSSQGCDNPGDFVGVSQLTNVECFLCETIHDAPPTMSPTTWLHGKIMEEQALKKQQIRQATKEGLEVGGIVGLVVGGLLAGGVGGLLWRRQRRVNSQKERNKSAEESNTTAGDSEEGGIMLT